VNVEGIREAYEEVEQRAVVDGLGDLRVAPADVAQPLDLFVRDAVGVPGQGLDEFQQPSSLGRQAGGVEISVTKRGSGL